MTEQSAPFRNTERPAAAARDEPQHVRRWHQRAGRLVVLRVLRVVTRGCQLGSAFTVLAYLAIDFSGFLHRSDTFLVPHITVRGNTRVSSGELIRVARLAPSIDLWAWPLADIRARVEGHPRIAMAQVHREFPDELVLDVHERQPVALLLAEALVEVDAEGVVLGPYDRTRSPVGPVLTGHGLGACVPGTRVDASAVREALALVQRYQASGSAGRVPISEVAVDSARGAVLWLGPGVRVPCPAGMPPLQWARLDAVLNDLRARGTGLHRVAAIDLRFAHIVPVRMRAVAAG